MGNLILPHSITKNLPFSVTSQLSSLPEEAQREFFDEFNLRSRSVVVSYILHIWVAGTHNLYLGKWVHFILYWLSWTLVIPGAIWWLVDLIRMPSMVKDYNSNLADDILKKILIKYKLYGRENAGEKRIEIVKETPSYNPSFNIKKPRNFDTGEYDPSNISVENIKTGYIIDFDIKSWEVSNEWQYDWDNGNTEKEFKLSSNNDFMFVLLTKEARQFGVKVGKPINIYSIDENIETEIQTKGRPYNVLLFEGITYYRESQTEGICYNMGDTSAQGVRVKAWDYYDTNRENHLRISERGRGEFRVLKARSASPYEFTDILPKD